jgi:hypothetical protein
VIKTLKAWIELQRALNDAGRPAASKIEMSLEQGEQLIAEYEKQEEFIKGIALRQAYPLLSTCNCIQTHADTCQATPRPVNLAAPWIGMRFWCSMSVNGWTECQIVQVTSGVIYFSPVERPNEGHSQVRTIWDYKVSTSQIKAEKP